jgi:hypothetical protein
LATSGSVDFNVNALTLLNGAYGNIGVKSAERPLTGYQIEQGLHKLNLIVKQWQGNQDFAPGFKAFSRKRAYIFLQKNQSVYSLGSTGDHATGSYVTTTISATEAAAQTTLSVTSSTGMTAADQIGIELDTGYIQWTTVSSTGVGSVVIPASGLTSQASAGNRVFCYTTKMYRPLLILTASLRDTDGNDYPIGDMDLYDYESIPNKSLEGTPGRQYYETQRINGVIYFDVTPSDVTNVVRLVYLSPIEDLDITTDDLDYPQHWYKPLEAQLSLDLCMPFNREVTDALKLALTSSLTIAQNADPATTQMYFQPGIE